MRLMATIKKLKEPLTNFYDYVIFYSIEINVRLHKFDLNVGPNEVLINIRYLNWLSIPFEKDFQSSKTSSIYKHKINTVGR